MTTKTVWIDDAELEARRARLRRLGALLGVVFLWCAFFAALGFGLFVVYSVVAVGLAAAVVGAAHAARERRGTLGAAASALRPRAASARMRLHALDGAAKSAAAGALAALRPPAVSARRRIHGVDGAAETAATSAARHALRLLRSAGESSSAVAAVVARRVKELAGATAERVASRTTASAGHRSAAASVALRRSGEVERAVAEAERAVDAFRSAGDQDGEARALNTLALALSQSGRYRDALDALDRGLSLLADTGARTHEARLLANLGTVHEQLGAPESARYCWEKALERFEPGSREAEQMAELLRR